MKNKVMLFVLATMACGASLQAETAPVNAVAKPQVVAPAVAQATKLSAEEQAFAAKLSDQNRKAFADKLTAEQRKAAMAAAKVSTAANAADEAVAKLAQSAVVISEQPAAEIHAK